MNDEKIQNMGLAIYNREVRIHALEAEVAQLMPFALIGLKAFSEWRTSYPSAESRWEELHRRIAETCPSDDDAQRARAVLARYHEGTR